MPDICKVMISNKLRKEASDPVHACNHINSLVPYQERTTCAKQGTSATADAARGGAPCANDGVGLSGPQQWDIN